MYLAEHIPSVLKNFIRMGGQNHEVHSTGIFFPTTGKKVQVDLLFGQDSAQTGREISKGSGLDNAYPFHIPQDLEAAKSN
jgi:hypothetical protein